jgi:hypothetical protein
VPIAGLSAGLQEVLQCDLDLYLESRIDGHPRVAEGCFGQASSAKTTARESSVVTSRKVSAAHPCWLWTSQQTFAAALRRPLQGLVVDRAGKDKLIPAICRLPVDRSAGMDEQRVHALR